MSICEVCMGKGHIIGQAPGTDASCPACHGKGYIEQTNEEWFCQLSTKEKAEFISELRHGMSERVMEIEEIFNDEDLDYEEAVEKWLKQPHKPFS